MIKQLAKQTILSVALTYAAAPAIMAEENTTPLEQTIPSESQLPHLDFYAELIGTFEEMLLTMTHPNFEPNVPHTVLDTLKDYLEYVNSSPTVRNLRSGYTDPNGPDTEIFYPNSEAMNICDSLEIEEKLLRFMHVLETDATNTIYQEQRELLSSQSGKIRERLQHLNAANKLEIQRLEEEQGLSHLCVPIASFSNPFKSGLTATI